MQKYSSRITQNKERSASYLIRECICKFIMDKIVCHYIKVIQLTTAKLSKD